MGAKYQLKDFFYFLVSCPWLKIFLSVLMASSTSSSPLILFMDTNLDTHFSFTIDGDESIAQLKGRIISEHANCFPQIGKISVEAVKAKCGEFFYHLSDSMIINYVFQNIGDDKLQIDIVPASSTVKSSSQTNDTASENPSKEISPTDTISNRNDNGNNSNKSEMVQFATSMKDSNDLKPKRKKKKKVTIIEDKPLVDDSLQNINDTASENPPKEIFPTDTINNDNGSNSNKSEILASFNGLPYHNNLQPIKSPVQATVDDKQNRYEKFVEVPPAQTKLVNSTLGDATAEVSQVKEYSLGKMGNEKVHLGIGSEIAVEHGDSSMGKVDDASHKKQTKIDIGAHMEKKPPETDVDMNLNCIFEAPVELDTNTSMKDPSDLKRKRKKKKKISSNEELRRNPLLEGSSLKVSDTRAENQPKEIFAKETISNSNDFENESGIEASIKESTQPVESLLQTTVDDKHNRKEKILKVSPPSKLLNNTSGDLDSCMHESVVLSGDLVNFDYTATDKILKHEQIKNKSEENDPAIQISNDPALRISGEEVINGLPIFLKETINEAPDKHGDGNIVRLDNSIKENAPTQKKRQRRVVRKFPISRFQSVLNNSNKDGWAPPTFSNSGSGSNRHDPEKTDSGSHAKVDSNVDLVNTKISPVEHGDSSMGKVDDASHKNQTKIDIGAHMEKKPPETDVDMNRSCIFEAPVELDTNTSMKDPSDLKCKRKKKKKISSNEELPRNPLLEDSSLKVSDTRAENQLKEIFAKETISNSNDFENESGIAASIKESTQPVESSLQTTVDDKHNRKEKTLKVSPPSKLLNNTSGDLDSCMHESVVLFEAIQIINGLVNFDYTATDKILKHEHIKNKSEENDPAIQISNDPALQISKEEVINGLPIFLKETINEASDKHGDGNIVRLDDSIKENAPAQKKKQRRVVRKIPMSRYLSVLNNSNKDGLAPPTFNNSGSGSNTHDPEKADSGSHAKVDSNVDLDNSKISPDTKGKRASFSCPLRDIKGRFVSSPTN